MAYCTCKDWVGNIDKVNADTRLAQARNPYTHPGYTGKGFSHCPWCGISLHKNDVLDASSESKILDT